jgi:hypothetical protein
MNQFLTFKKLFHVDASDYQDEIKSPELNQNTEIVVSYDNEVLGIVSFCNFCKVINEYYDVINSSQSYRMKILSIVWLWKDIPTNDLYLNTSISKQLFQKIARSGMDEEEVFMYFLVKRKILPE